MVSNLNPTRRILEGMDQSGLGQGESINRWPDRPWRIDNLTIRCGYTLIEVTDTKETEELYGPGGWWLLCRGLE